MLRYKGAKKTICEKVKLKDETYYEMEKNQREAYRAIHNLIFYLQSKNKWLPKTKAYQLTSFLQKIASGFIPDETELKEIFGNLGSLGDAADNVQKIKTIVYADKNKRIDCLKEELGRYGSKQVIIWCRYLAEIDSIINNIPNCGRLTGGLGSKNIDKVITDFKEGKFQYLVASQGLSLGFNIPFVSVVIYYSTLFDWINRLQSEDRPHRINREGILEVVDIIAKGSIDERIQEVLTYKEDICTIFESKSVDIC
jgi:superfamily II DNA/RNA helicase